MGCVKEVLKKMPLSVTPGRSTDENRCVAFQTQEDFTAHLEVHPLKHLLCRVQFRCGVMCIIPILHHANEHRLRGSPTNTNHEMVRRSTRHKRSLNENKKCHKQILKLKDVVVGNGPLKLNVKCLSLNELRNNIVVCDGGDTDSDAIKDTYGIHCLCVHEGDLWVTDG